MSFKTFHRGFVYHPLLAAIFFNSEFLSAYDKLFI
jgi:hypothetical protein